MLLTVHVKSSHVDNHLDQILCRVVKWTRAHQKLHLIALGENYSRFKEGLVVDGCEQNVENLSGKKIKMMNSKYKPHFSTLYKKY